MRRFRGWPAEALEFYDGLEAENTKAYWQRHRHEYDTLVREPMEALLTELEPNWGEWRIFRPYRDVRFSVDRSPYKTHIGAVIGDGYIQLGAEGMAAGSGMWEMAPDQLERYRGAVDSPRAGVSLERIVEEVRRLGFETTGRGMLKTTPRGYPRDHPRIALLRYRGLAAWKAWSTGAWLGTHRAKDRIEVFFRASEPLNEWLHGHVGPSRLPDDPRR
ncbi:MAG: DUF2461 domain-containing protein [Actinomycetota bacterium]